VAYQRNLFRFCTDDFRLVVPFALHIAAHQKFHYRLATYKLHSSTLLTAIWKEKVPNFARYKFVTAQTNLNADSGSRAPYILLES